MTIEGGLRNPTDESATGDVRRFPGDRGIGEGDLPALRDYLDGLVRGRITVALSPDVPLVSLGFDSLAAVELWARLRTDLGLDIPATDLLDLTPAALTARVWAQIEPAATAAAAGPLAAGDEVEA